MNPFNLLVDVLGTTLAFFYSIVPSYGIAIVLLTLLVSFLLFPLTLKQTRSMKAMQEIQPDVKRIQKDYKDNREEMQQELMALYKERGVNPAAGCLPLILQAPIWFALFRLLRIGVDESGQLTDNAIPAGSDLARALENGETTFLGMNLLLAPSEAIVSGIVAALPYILAVLVVVAAGYFQQQQATSRANRKRTQELNPQMQGMQTAMKFMPIVIGFVSWGFPAGLVLYWATSNIFRIGQQTLIFWMDEQEEARDEPGVEGRRANPAPPPSAETAPPNPPPSKPSPHASKKRKKRRRK